MKEAKAPIEIVVPQSTIFSEHPAVIVDRNVAPEERPVMEAFRNFLWSEEAQRAFVRHHFRSTTDERLNEANIEFARIEVPFDVQYFGGWQRALPEIIEGVYREQVQNRK